MAGRRRRAAAAALAALAALAAVCLPGGAAGELVLPIRFTPIKADNDTVLFPLYANTSLFGVFIAGLEFGNPPQKLQLLIDTGSGITHVAGAGCGSACGLGLPESAGYNGSASSTSSVVPCGELCSCPRCECSTQGVAEPQCSYMLSYADGSSSTGALVSDTVVVGREPVDMQFGVQERQTGVLQSMGIDGLLGLDRSHGSFVGQLRDLNLTDRLAFGTCWEVDYGGYEQGYPERNASSYLLFGLPNAVVEDLQPTWTPLLPGPPSEWEVGIVGVEVMGPGGGNITEELWKRPAPPPMLGGNGTAPAGGGAGAAAARRMLRSLGPALGGNGTEGPPQGMAIMDSGATYTHLPREAWKRFQALVTSAAAARGKVKQVVARDSATCWEGLGADTLTTDAAAVGAAFPTLKFRFAGGGEFVASPEGYLVSPDTGGAHLACLSIFPWDAPLALIGSRIRRRVLSIMDDAGSRVGFANVEDCAVLAELWAAA